MQKTNLLGTENYKYLEAVWGMIIRRIVEREEESDSPDDATMSLASDNLFDFTIAIDIKKAKLEFFQKWRLNIDQERLRRTVS